MRENDFGGMTYGSHAFHTKDDWRPRRQYELSRRLRRSRCSHLLTVNVRSRSHAAHRQANFRERLIPEVYARKRPGRYRPGWAEERLQ